MALVQSSRRIPSVEVSPPARYPWRRAVALGGLLGASLVFSLLLARSAPPDSPYDSPLSQPFMHIWLLSFLPYLAACALILLTKPGPGRWRWIELGVILAGAFFLRVLLLPLPPELSRDSWRYLWDARVTLHGFSPYVFRPDDPALRFLTNTGLFPRMRFRSEPTIYPPGAQAIFLLSYLLAGPNLYVLKGIFLLFDLVTCGALLVLLHRRKLDMSRVLIYAWCPLPIVEFAMQGHVDVITLTFSILALLSLANQSVGGRILTGFLIGMAALTKIYPILLLLVVVPEMLRGARERGRPFFCLQWRDWALLATCLLTILGAYLPYYILGNGHILGFFSSYASEQGTNAGPVQLVMEWISYAQHWGKNPGVLREHIGSLTFFLLVAVGIFVLRWRAYIGREMATLVLFGAILAVSTHVFPWYSAILLLWIPLLIDPIQRGMRLSGKLLALGGVWYFVCISPLSYFYGNAQLDWTTYYQVAYFLAIILAAAAIVGLVHLSGLRKEKRYANHS
jgi:hypothetical protein